MHFESALHQLVSRIERALDSNQYSLGVFFDIEGAFDNTPMKSVSKALADWKVPTIIRSWIIAMLLQRTVQATVGSITITISTQRGLPQGGGLSPILWSLVAYYYYLASAVAAVVFSQVTASSSASCSLVRPPSSCVSRHVSTMWPMVCRWPQLQSSDAARPHLCKLALVCPEAVQYSVHDWRGRSKPGC